MRPVIRGRQAAVFVYEIAGDGAARQILEAGGNAFDAAGVVSADWGSLSQPDNQELTR
jgi:gamma-glutamyltranspeptidase